MFYRNTHIGVRCFVLVSYVLSLIDGCGTLAGNPEDPKKGSGKTASTIAQNGGITTFAVASIPLANAKNFFITVASLAVTQNGSDWTNVPIVAGNATADILALRSAAGATIGSLDQLPAGVYTQTRLALAATTPTELIATDGSTQVVPLPTSQQNGILIDTPFTVTAGTPLNLTLAFDLRQSLKATTATTTAPAPSTPASPAQPAMPRPPQPPQPPQLPQIPQPPPAPAAALALVGQHTSAAPSLNGPLPLLDTTTTAATTYAFTPVLRLLVTTTLGTIAGISSQDEAACVYPVGTVPDATDSCAGSVSSGIVLDGTFQASLLPAGTYNVRLYPTLSTGTPTDLNHITVTAGQMTNLGTVH